ncbi:hypothetical protein OY671_008309, partial [Metschnikowia pulcherrima]
MKSVTGSIVSAAAVVPTIAHAQDEGAAEVIVSAMRRNADDYSADMPAVGSRRTADFAIQEVTITGDTRDAGQRADEIYAMLANAIAGASKAGVQLAFGERVVQAVTLKNYRDLSLERDSRPDSQQLKFSVKSPSAAGTDAASAQARIARPTPPRWQRSAAQQVQAVPAIFVDIEDASADLQQRRDAGQEFSRQLGGRGRDSELPGQRRQLGLDPASGFHSSGFAPQHIDGAGEVANLVGEVGMGNDSIQVAGDQLFHPVSHPFGRS